MMRMQNNLERALNLELYKVMQVGEIKSLKYASNREAATLLVLVSRINDMIFKVEVVRPDGNTTHCETVEKHNLQITLKNLESFLRRRSTKFAHLRA